LTGCVYLSIMRLRELSFLLLVSWLNSAAGQPPIAVEWVAFRPSGYGTIFTPAYIDRDPITSKYLWAVEETGWCNDEAAYLFDSSGTEVTLSFPDCFNVGSLDHLEDIEVVGDSLYYIEYHQALVGDIFWHLFANSGEFIVMSPSDSPDYANDLLIDGSDIFVSGMSATESFSEGRLVRTNLAASPVWNITWDSDSLLPFTGFLSVAAHGDTIATAVFPQLALFDRTSGSFIDTLDLFSSSWTGERAGHILEHDGVLHWAARMGATVYYGAWDLASGPVWSGEQAFTSATGDLDLVVDDDGHTWIGCTADNAGQILRIDPSGTLLGVYATYAGVSDLEWTNGKISITGQFLPADPTSYVITGVPIP
jgi:hypothetical protein